MKRLSDPQFGSVFLRTCRTVRIQRRNAPGVIAGEFCIRRASHVRGELSGKRAIVCGSAQGIRRACAVEIARLGAGVTLVARDEQTSETGSEICRPAQVKRTMQEMVRHV
jgi:hypothetical protein